MNQTKTPAVARAISKYGVEVCKRAYYLNRVQGEGAYTTGVYLGLTTRQADAAINAGAFIAKAV